MQAQKTSYLHGTVKLITDNSKGQPLAIPIWRLRYRVPGKQSDKVLGKAWLKQSRPPEGYLTKAQAEAAAQVFLDEHARAVPDSRRTFARAWADFLANKERIKRPLRGSTRHEYERIYAELAQRPWKRELTWAERPIADFAAADVTAVYEELEERGLAASTINHHRRIVRACIGNHITIDWPFLSEQSEESNGKLRFYSRDQVRRLKEHAYDDCDRAIYTVAAEGGLRLSEILGMKVGNVDFEMGKLRIEDGYTKRGGHGATKSHQVRSVELSDHMHTALWPYCIGRDDEELVFERDDQPGEPLCGTSLYRRFKSTAKRAGLPEIRFHELRHSFGTMAIRKFNIYEVQRMMGHKSITTTERYLHYAPDPEAAAKINALWADDDAVSDNVVSMRRRATS